MGYLHTYLDRIHQEAHSTRRQETPRATAGQAGPTRVRPRPWHRLPNRPLEVGLLTSGVTHLEAVSANRHLHRLQTAFQSLYKKRERHRTNNKHKEQELHYYFRQ